MHYEEAGGSVRTPGHDSESHPQENYCLSLAKATGWIQLKTYRHLGTEYTEVTSTDGWAVTNTDLAPQNPEDIKFPNPGTIKGSQQSFCMRKPCNKDKVGEEHNLPECCPPGLGGPVPLSDVWNHMRSQQGGDNRCNWTHSPDYNYHDKNAQWTWLWIQYGWGKNMPCCHCDEDEGDDVACRGEKNEFEWSLDFKVPSRDVFKTISDMLDRDLAHKPCPPSGSYGTTAVMEGGNNALNPEHLVGRSARKNNVEVLNNRRVGRTPWAVAGGWICTAVDGRKKCVYSTDPKDRNQWYSTKEDCDYACLGSDPW